MRIEVKRKVKKMTSAIPTAKRRVKRFERKSFLAIFHIIMAS
jgi:hypothetical protein